MDRKLLSHLTFARHAAGFLYLAGRFQTAVSLGGDPERFGPEVTTEAVLTGDTADSRQAVLERYFAQAQAALGPSAPSDPLPEAETTFQLLEITIEPQVSLPAWGRLVLTFVRTEWVNGIVSTRIPGMWEIQPEDMDEQDQAFLVTEFDAIEAREGCTVKRADILAAKLAEYQAAVDAEAARVAALVAEGQGEGG